MMKNLINTKENYVRRVKDGLPKAMEMMKDTTDTSTPEADRPNL